jgi:hypothetical protein
MKRISPLSFLAALTIVVSAAPAFAASNAPYLSISDIQYDSQSGDLEISVCNSGDWLYEELHFGSISFTITIDGKTDHFAASGYDVNVDDCESFTFTGAFSHFSGQGGIPAGHYGVTVSLENYPADHSSVYKSVTLSEDVPPAAPFFSDVPLSHPNNIAINYVHAEGIVGGYSDYTFRPNNPINRAEFSKILYLSHVSRIPQAELDRLGAPLCELTEDSPFADVPKDAWFRFYVCQLETMGHVDGYPDGTFRPGNSINFVEAAKILANEFDLPAAQTNVWFEGYVRALADENAIPTSITTFDQLITRGEMAEMIYRLQTGITDKPSQTYEDLASETGWKVYRNKDAKIVFSYPSSYTIVTDEIRATYEDGKSWYRIDLESGAGEGAGSIRIEVNPDGYGPFFTDKTYTLTEVAKGMSAQKMINVASVDISEPSENSDDDYLLITGRADLSNGNWFFSAFSVSEDRTAEEEIFKQVLQTVQILP